MRDVEEIKKHLGLYDSARRTVNSNYHKHVVARTDVTRRCCVVGGQVYSSLCRRLVSESNLVLAEGCLGTRSQTRDRYLGDVGRRRVSVVE